MMWGIVSALIFLSNLAETATIAELITQQSSTLSRAAAAIPNNPAWSRSSGNYTLFLPTDAAISAAGNLGTNPLGKVFVQESIAFMTAAQYFVMTDVDGVRVIYGNIIAITIF